MNLPGEIRKYSRVLMAVLSGILIGLAFPPVPAGILATIAFTPFFYVLEQTGTYRQGLRLTYLTFFPMNLVTLYWAGGFLNGGDWYMMVAGALLLIVHPIFFAVPVSAWIFLRKRFGIVRAFIAFPLLWVAFEYLHSLWEIGFPWLTLGYTQSYNLYAIQMASLTGVYGISLWILILNVLAYLLYRMVAAGRMRLLSPAGYGFLALIIALYLLPNIYGFVVMKHESDSDEGLAFSYGIVQPNIDPFEKWAGSAQNQMDRLLGMTGNLRGKPLDLILWPETAVPFFILHPDNRYYFDRIKREIDQINIPLLSGIPDIVYYTAQEKAPGSSRKLPDGSRYETFNSSMLLKPDDAGVQKYAKIVLVPFAERVPFSEALSFLNAMQWNFGLGGWGIGPDTTIFHCSTRTGRPVQFSTMICYESAYPGFVAAFVRKGAEFLTVLTNDSWWGNTSGAYQHRQIAVLRAVENRRWVLQCANGGISFAIDPYGRILHQMAMYSTGTLTGTLRCRTETTFYTKTGDWVGEFSLMLSAMAIMAAIGSSYYTSVRRKEEDESRSPGL